MHKFHPLVSIVIPVYNGANYMREAIDSALAQTYDNCEILVINDGSIDSGETDRIARSYGDKIRYFAKENGGVATALNMGIREMRGDYFSWLSHDDVYLPNKIEKQIAFMGAYELQDVVLFSDYAVIDAQGDCIAERHMRSVPPDCVFEYLYITPEMHGCAMLIPRSAFDEVGLFPEDLPTTQDYDLWLRMCRVRPFVHQAEVLIQARSHAEQGTYTIQGHSESIAKFYRDYFPALLETATSNKTPEEASRQRVYLFEQLCRRRLEIQAGELAAKAETDAEKNTMLHIRRAVLAEHRRAAVKSFAKRMLRPLKPLLPMAMLRQWKANTASGTIFSSRAESAPDPLVRRPDFRQFYLENTFGAVESFSGGGSSLFQTRIVRRELPMLLKKLGISSMMDIPCGDFNWMHSVDLGSIRYIGGDIVPELVERNRAQYASEQHSFMHLDAVSGPLPEVDLIFCRDCLVHIPLADALKAIRTFKASGARWLLTTTFVSRTQNLDLTDCVWRPLNLCLAPFNLPEPQQLLDEKCVEHGGIFTDKALGLWDLHSLCV